MMIWRDDYEQIYIEEMMWNEGLRYAEAEPRCASCNIRYSPPPPSSPNTADQSTTTAPIDVYADPDLPPLDPPRPPEVSEIFCCLECGDFLECAGCCLKRHQCMPLHVIQVRRAR